MKRLFIFLFFVVLTAGAVIYGMSAAQDYWPAESWRTSAPEEQGMDSGILADMIDTIRESDKSVNSITIIRNGYLVHETYFYPYQKGILHSLNSCTKGVISSLVGIAIHDGSIKSVDDRVLDYFSDAEIANNDRRKQNITIKDLMTMSAGIKWDFANNSSTNEMQQTADWTGFYLDLPMEGEPGATFNYCNGASQTLASVLQKATGKKPSDLFAEKLQIGISDMFWTISPEKVSAGYSGIYMHPDDMARFGYLYLRNGTWNGQRLILKKWVAESTKPQIKANWGPLLPDYGYMWWTTRFGGYAALGYGGQYIFVVPEHNLVVVFTCGLFQGKDSFYPMEWMENYILPSIKSDKKLDIDKAASERLRKASDMVQNAPLPLPADALPEIAGKISGKTYKMDNSETLTFWFSGVNECKFDLNSKLIMKIGLDQTYRINDMGNFISGGYDRYHGAFKGCWLDENTLQVNFSVLEEGFETVYTAEFEGDRIELKSTTNMADDETVMKGKFN
jgi:CubicO group peptidase (beta-lactamase class C family)